MTTVHIDVRQLSGEIPDVEPSRAGNVWIKPFTAYHVEDGGEDYLVGVHVLKVRLVDGVADVELPETPINNLLKVEVRGVGYPSFFVQIPAGDCNLFDLPHIDPDTLDPTVPPSPAWLAALEAVQSDLTGKADASTVYTKTQGDARYATTAQGVKADAAATADALAAEVSARSSTDTAFATTLNDYSIANNAAVALRSVKSANLSDLASGSAARENLALSDYDKLRPFFADLANWRNKRVDIAFYGDSAVEGYALTNWDHTLPAQLCAMLRSKNGIPTGGRGLIGIQNDKTNQPFWPDVYTGGTISAAGYGVSMRQIGLTASGHKYVRAVPAAGLSSFALYYSLYSAGVMYSKADAAANVNQSTAGGGTIIPTKTTVPTAVTSTLEIGWVSGSPFPAGIQEFKGDENSGLQVHNLGMSGTYAKFWNDRNTLSWPGFGALLALSLIIVNLGGNDGRAAGGNRTAAQFQTDLTTLLGTLGTTVSTTAPIVVNMQWSLGDAALLEPWANYVAAARTVCAANARAVLIDHSARMYPSNTVPDSLALYNAASPPHAVAKGYALEAATIARALEPR